MDDGGRGLFTRCGRHWAVWHQLDHAHCVLDLGLGFFGFLSLGLGLGLGLRLGLGLGLGLRLGFFGFLGLGLVVLLDPNPTFFLSRTSDQALF